MAGESEGEGAEERTCARGGGVEDRGELDELDELEVEVLEG